MGDGVMETWSEEIDKMKKDEAIGPLRRDDI